MVCRRRRYRERDGSVVTAKISSALTKSSTHKSEEGITLSAKSKVKMITKVIFYIGSLSKAQILFQNTVYNKEVKSVRVFIRVSTQGRWCAEIIQNVNVGTNPALFRDCPSRNVPREREKGA